MHYKYEIGHLRLSQAVRRIIALVFVSSLVSGHHSIERHKSLVLASVGPLYDRGFVCAVPQLARSLSAGRLYPQITWEKQVRGSRPITLPRGYVDCIYALPVGGGFVEQEIKDLANSGGGIYTQIRREGGLKTTDIRQYIPREWVH